MKSETRRTLSQTERMSVRNYDGCFTVAAKMKLSWLFSTQLFENMKETDSVFFSLNLNHRGNLLKDNGADIGGGISIAESTDIYLTQEEVQTNLSLIHI